MIDLYIIYYMVEDNHDIRYIYGVWALDLVSKSECSKNQA